MPVVTMPSRSCPRKLQKGECKRYMSKGPLFGYMISCPACGFIELHQHEKACFIDEATDDPDRPWRLIGAEKHMHCMLCTRVISIAGGIIMAVKPA